jgi:hypothetical protein
MSDEAPKPSVTLVTLPAGSEKHLVVLFDTLHQAAGVLGNLPYTLSYPPQAQRLQFLEALLELYNSGAKLRFSDNKLQSLFGRVITATPYYYVEGDLHPAFIHELDGPPTVCTADVVDDRLNLDTLQGQIVDYFYG